MANIDDKWDGKWVFVNPEQARLLIPRVANTQWFARHYNRNPEYTPGRTKYNKDKSNTRGIITHRPLNVVYEPEYFPGRTQY